MSDLLFSVFPNENFVDLGLYQYGWEQCASQIYATMYGSIRWYFLLGLVFGVAVIQKLIASGEKIHKKTRKNLEIIRKNR